MENNNKTKLTHKQKMDLVTEGLHFLTTQEVEALIETIKAFKTREELIPHSCQCSCHWADDTNNPMIYRLPGVTFDARDVSRFYEVNQPEGSWGLSISFRDGTGYCSHFETRKERDRAAEDLLNRINGHSAGDRPSLGTISTADLVAELRCRRARISLQP